MAKNPSAFVGGGKGAQGLDADCPWDMWLRFRNPDVEARFVTHSNEKLTGVDAITNKIPVLLGPAKVFSWKSTGLVRTALHHTWLLSSSLTALVILAAIRSDPAMYTARRIHINSVYRLVISIGNGLVVMLEDTLDVWDANSMGVGIVSKSPIAGMLLMGMALRVPFKRHVLIQGVLTCLSCLWVTKFCEACRFDDEIDAAVNRIGWSTDGFMQRLSTLGVVLSKRPDPSAGQYPCWLVGVFYHWWLGFFLPSVVVYVSECLSRWSFLKPMLEERDAARVKIALHSRLILTGATALIGSQVLWFVLKAMFASRVICEGDVDMGALRNGLLLDALHQG
ncbi:hypothetical protein BSKO_13969 [Bryopsis sp. KO-2023]|nr:hypothetical protein BSKO_13969 [Bryopsis sp. KO-2023]